MYSTYSTPKISLVGRLLLAVIFILSGLSKIPGWEGTLGYMATKGIPAPGLFLFCAIVIELIAGICLLVGYRSRESALLLFLYLVPVTLIMHKFWGLAPADSQMQLINFLKNVAIMGGLLQVVAFGPGVISVDYKKRPESVVGERRVA